MTPFVSVIVPAFEHAEALARCLDALERQSWPADRYEVIVVDNGSRADLAAVAAGFRHVRVAREMAPGSYAARNRGIALARGEVLAFTDTDCIPAGDWIQQGARRLLAAPGEAFVAGRVEQFVADPARPTAAELYDTFVLNFRQERNVRERGFGATANLFVRASVFARIGAFDAALRSGGDLEWGRRALSHGVAGIYAPDATVRHPARRALGETLRRAARHAGGVYAIERRGAQPLPRFLAHLARRLTPAVHFYWRILRGREPRRVMDRLRVVGVAIAVKYAESWALIRLRLGGAPERG